MKKSRFTEEQIAYALKQAELGMAVGEICRKLGIAEATFYVWRKKYGGLGPSELKRLRLLEEENRKLKQLVADLSLDKAMLQEVVNKKALRATQKRNWVARLRERFGVSERRALRIVAMSRSAFSYKAMARDCSAIRLRMREITQTRIHYGCERVLVMLRREGWRDNHKRVHRIYKEEGLSLRHCRPRRSRSSRRRQPIKVATAPNTLWGMDFVSDALFDGRRFRLLPVLDHFTHECLDIVVDQSLRADDVAEAVARLVVQRGRPEAIKVDNGSEFAGKVMDRWAYENGVELDFSRRGTPTDNAMVESFNGRLRQECLNEHWFLSLADARSKIEAWRRFYNEERPHSALAWRTPAEFAREHGSQANLQAPKKVEISTC
ncbi:IS3 family transposase [Xanthomonas euvesicatoria]|uniref:IS3 family transposase n=1 Tax=Xanthomonas euvesicatoria TaxID=456327 RepID=UPI000F8EB8F6|nr:IS3 family transposase [Xanthomonas euvesicatoria]